MASRSPRRPVRSKSSSSSTPTVPERKSVPYTPRCTTDEYIKAIAHHSQQSSADTLYPGDIYDTLKRFFEQKSHTLTATSNQAPNDFAWLISPGHLGKQIPSDKQSFVGSRSGSDYNGQRGQSEGFNDPDLCIEALRCNIELSQPQVLFLRGHPSPEWLASIGAFCYVDPELFRQFLNYRTGPEGDYYSHSAPPLMSNIFSFKIFTIGSKNKRYQSSQEEIDNLRAKAANDMHKYRTDLKGNWTLKLGDSIVRDFHVLDGRHCFIEQDIVVSILDVGKTWMVIACTDAGHDLKKGPQLPWMRTSSGSLPMTILPTIQYKPKCALKSRNITTRSAGSMELKNPQSLAIFPEGYGRAIDWSLSNSDRFHVLSDMFRLALFSQKQLLNLMKEKIIAETNQQSLNEENPTLANLLYFRTILHGQLNNASNILQLIKEENGIFQNGHSSSAAPSVAQSEAASAMAQIHSLFLDLQSQAHVLQEMCTQGMTLISNKSMLAESERAIQQAKSVTKLTLVAFVYLPFTFTCGFFGMNFRELGNGTISLWIFFAVSMPLMLITMAVFAFDMQTVKRWFHSLHFGDRELKTV